MKTFFFILALSVISVSAWGDDLTKAVQQKLKDQGFFYGEATGQPGSETDASIRRYQIRYGLKVTGALNDETMRSLGLKVGDFPPPQKATRHGNETGASTPRPQDSAPQALPPRTIPSPTPRLHVATPRPSPSEEARPRVQPQAPTYRAPSQEQEPNEETPENEPPNQSYNRGPNGGGYENPYGGSPNGRASGRARPPRVVATVQIELARRGFYQGPVDGEFGEMTVDAIGRFQESRGLPPTGRIDNRTLLALHLVPGGRVRRVYRVYAPYGPYRPYGPYGPGPYRPYGPYGLYARNYW